MYSPDPEGREGLIFTCCLKFQKIVGSRKSDCVGMGGRVLKTGLSLNLCPHICVPVTALTFSIPAVTTLAEGSLDRGHNEKRNSFFFFFSTRISLELIFYIH